MQGEHLPLQHHTARYCPGSKMNEHGEAAPTAFFLKKDESYLSVEWMEYMGQSCRTEEIRVVIDILSQKLSLGSSARIAVLGVGSVCAHVLTETGYPIQVLHEPEPNDPAHSGIHGSAVDEIIIAGLIAESVEEMHPVKSI